MHADAYEPTPLADQFLEDLSRWRVEEHRGTATTALEKIEELLAMARRGEIRADVAVIAAHLEAGAWFLEFQRLMATT